MNDPTGRVLELLSLLQTHRMWSGEELAVRLDVTPRTVRRDIARLRELGYLVDALPGREGGYRLAAGSHLPPLVLDDDEAVAIAVGLRAAAGAAIVGIEETSVRALAKLQQLLPDRLRRRTQAITANLTTYQWSGDESAVDVDTLTLVAQGCRDAEEMRFSYRRRDGEESERLVQPHQLVTVGRRWYVVSWDCRREDWRTFRLDRISNARLAGARFEPRPIPNGDAAAFVAASLDSAPRPHQATIGVGVSAEELLELMPWLADDVVTEDESRCRVVVRATEEAYLVAGISRLAQRFPIDVEAAPSVHTQLRAIGARLVDV